MRTLINGHKLNVEVFGSSSSPPVVLLHHGLGSIRAWKDQVSFLSENGWQVFVYDRWGYGFSEPRPALSVPGFEDDLEDLDALLDAWEISQVSLVGHSDGGTIGLYYAAQNPERVRCLVTIAAHIYVERPKMEFGIEGIRQTFEQGEYFKKALTRSHGPSGETTFWNWYNGWVREDILTWDMRPVLERIACPTLVIQGSKDEHASPKHAEDIAAAIPDSELWLVPDAAHMLPQDVPELLNPRLLDFLQEHGQ